MLLVILGTVTVVLSAPIAGQNSTGPVQGLSSDAGIYQAEIDGALSTSIQEASIEGGREAGATDLTLGAWRTLATSSEVFGESVAAAHVGAMTGLHGSAMPRNRTHEYRGSRGGSTACCS